MLAEEDGMSSQTKTPLLGAGIVLNGKWEILEHIATGGKGEVYCARQNNLDREVVVKIVSTEYLAEFGDDKQEVETEIERFHREALAMAQVRHPYVAQVYDQDAATILKDGKEAKIRYVVMEYVPGGCTLRNTMPDDGFKGSEKDLRQWIRIYFLPIFDGLETVHELGIVHRDMKPENVLLDGSTPKIIDFGIAGGQQWTRLTKSHHVEGTITYMAPEQFLDLGETDARADVYALGKILYEAVEGKMVDHKTACPLRGVCLSNPSTPFLKELDLIVQESTAEDREKRTPSVKALREGLERVLKNAEVAEQPLLRGLRRKQIIAIIVVLVIIVAATNVYHHLIMVHEESQPVSEAPADSPPSPGQDKTAVPDAATSGRTPPAATLLGKDGSTMRLVPGGEFTVSEFGGSNTARTLNVPSFYMDETKVTNARYVEFLNQVLPRLTVKDGVVGTNGGIWLFLGSVYEGYEPILFRDGRFSLKDNSYASYPVVRVTAYGVSAYVKFYGCRLPTEPEWLQAIIKGGKSSAAVRPRSGWPTTPSTDLATEMQGWLEGYTQKDQVEGPDDLSVNSSASLVPHPVTTFGPDADSIRGLGENVSEWGLRPGNLAGKGDRQADYVVLGGLRGSILHGSVLIPGLPQDASAAFGDVGFRCVASIPGQEK
jgi:eukaryotic-like serine/threonine-protein kinase